MGDFIADLFPAYRSGSPLWLFAGNLFSQPVILDLEKEINHGILLLKRNYDILFTKTFKENI